MGDVSTVSTPSWLPALSHVSFVVNRFEESLDPWGPVAPLTYMYVKHDTPQANDSVQHDSFREYNLLPNTGREGRTYCQHIVDHYDSLEDIIIFAQAAPFDGLLSPAVNTTEQMLEIALMEPSPEFAPVTIFNNDLIHDLAQWSKINWSAPNEAYWITPSEVISLALAPFDMAQYWQYIFGETHPPAVRVSHGGTFAVRREAIVQHPKSLYQRCLDRFECCGQNVDNPEVGFFLERTWLAIWSRKFWLNKIQIPK